MKYSFFSQRMCTDYTNKINQGVNDSDRLTIRCKDSFGKKGVCIQYTGNKSKYKKYKSCRNKNTKPEHIVLTGGGEKDLVMCDSVDDYLFPYLQEMIYPWKDDTKDKIFSEEFTRETPNYIDYVIAYQQDKFCGMIMIEMNECDKTNPDGLYSVKLICVQKVGKVSAAMQLLGLYLYVLKLKFPKQQYGFLELAGGYRNVIGYCLYSKLNFKVDPSFDCLEYEINNLSNLKMRVEMSSIDVKILIEKVRRNEWYDLHAFKRNNTICKRCEDSTCENDKQKLLMKMQTKYEADIPDVKKKDRNNHYIPWTQNKNLFSDWHDLYKTFAASMVDNKQLPQKKVKSSRKKASSLRKTKSSKKARRKSVRLNNKSRKDGSKDDEMQKLCDQLAKAVSMEEYFFKKCISEIAGEFYKGEFDNLQSGEKHSIKPPANYYSDAIRAKTTVSFHTHPNDFNELLHNADEVLDFPSGKDIKFDLYYPLIDTRTGFFKNSIQAIVTLSWRHQQVGVFMYKQIFTEKLAIDNLDVIAGYYQIVKLVALDFDWVQAGELFRTMDSKKMNDYLTYLKINLLKDDFEKWLHGPSNMTAGTNHWPWQKEHFKIDMFEFVTSKVDIV